MHPMPSAGLPQAVTDHTCHPPHRFNELATKSKRWNGKPSLERVNGRHSSSETPVGVLLFTCQSKLYREMTERLDLQTKHATITSGLRLGRSKVLRSLRHYLRAQSQGNHTIDRLEERGVERGSAGQFSSKRRLRAIVNQTKIGTASKATLGNLPRDGVERIWAFPRA